MNTNSKSRGTWIHRFAIRLFTLVLAVLVFWVLGFLVEDIRSIRGPDYNAIEQKHMDKDLVGKRAALEKQISELTRQIENQTEKQRVVGDSSRNLQQTINQLIELQKLGMQKNIAFSDTEQANFTSSLNLSTRSSYRAPIAASKKQRTPVRHAAATCSRIARLVTRSGTQCFRAARTAEPKKRFHEGPTTNSFASRLTGLSD